MAVVVVCSVVVDVETAETIDHNYRVSIHILFYKHVLYKIIMVNLHYFQPFSSEVCLLKVKVLQIKNAQVTYLWCNLTSPLHEYENKNLTLNCYCHWIRMSGWFLYLSLHHSEEAGYSHRWTLTSRPNTDLRSSEWDLTWWALFCVTFSSIYDKNTHLHLQIFSILTAQLNCVCLQNNRSRRCQPGPRKI